METSTKTSASTSTAVLRALKALRKGKPPLSEELLGSQSSLTALLFLDDLDAGSRTTRLRTALEFAVKSLDAEHQIVFREVYLTNSKDFVSRRLRRAADEINAIRSDAERVVGDKNALYALERAEERLVEILLDSDFAAQLDEQHPLKKRSRIRAAGPVPEDAFEMVDYSCEMDVGRHGPKSFIEHQVIRFRMVLPHQRVFGLRYYNDRKPPVPEYTTLANDEQSYLGSLPDPDEGGPAGWCMHFVHLGRRQKPGEPVTVDLLTEYLDRGEGERRPSVAVVMRFDALERIALGLRLPEQFRDEATVEATVVDSPYNNPKEIESWEVELGADGYARETFTELTKGLQYGLFVRGVEIYKS
jgi:hypothetical protein